MTDQTPEATASVAELIAEIRRDHRPWVNEDYPNAGAACTECGTTYPCTPVRLADATTARDTTVRNEAADIAYATVWPVHASLADRVRTAIREGRTP